MVAPLTWAGSTAALATSASTHATIDRRWLVRLIIRAKGCQDFWAEAPYLLDQSLHVGALLIAAVLAAAVTSAAGAAVVTGAGGVLIAATLLAERVQATAARRHPVSPYRV